MFFKRTIIPSPAFINKPANKAPNGMELDKYNSEIRTLLTQLGIKPMNVANKGVRYLFDVINEINAFSPTLAIISPNEKLITKTKANISKEWINGWIKCL